MIYSTLLFLIIYGEMFYFTIIIQKLNFLIFRYKVFMYTLDLTFRNIKYAFPILLVNIYILLNSGSCCIEHILAHFTYSMLAAHATSTRPPLHFSHCSTIVSKNLFFE